MSSFCARKLKGFLTALSHLQSEGWRGSYAGRQAVKRNLWQSLRCHFNPAKSSTSVFTTQCCLQAATEQARRGSQCSQGFEVQFSNPSKSQGQPEDWKR